MKKISFLRELLFICIVGLMALFCTGLQPSQPPTGEDVRFTPQLQRAYFEIQKLRIASAREMIGDERSSNAQNAVIPYLDNYADLHELLISEDRTAYKTLAPKEDQRLALVARLPDSSPYKLFFQAEIRMHWAFAKIKFGNEISGAWEVIRAYRLLEENKKKFPAFLPTLKSLGLLHILIGSVPENYSWVTRILGLKGNIQLGVKELQQVIKEDPFFRQETQLIDLLMHAYTLQLSEAQKDQIKQLPKEQPDNLLLHFFATTILMKEGKSEEALYYLQTAPTGNNYISFPFLDYLKGEIALQKGQYDNAFSFYRQFQKRYKGFNYLKDTNLKLFMCRWLAGQDADADGYMRRIGNSGTTIVEADQLAQRLSEDYIAGKFRQEQKVLYKARYAADGGYLEEANALLQSFSEKSFTTITDQAEYNYRRARILQKSGVPDKAIPFYERTITLSQNAPGFGASAALQLGYICRNRHLDEKAVYYFKKATSYKKHEYKNSIDNKARAALTGMGR